MTRTSRFSLLTLSLALALPALAADLVPAAGEDIDTGSRSVRVPAGLQVGDIDTGSGGVHLAAGASCGVIDSGSGSVHLGDEVRSGPIDTGSGGVRVGQRVIVDGAIDTGSGRVSIGAGSVVRGEIDTGSGEVELQGAIVERGIDTGSGHVRLVDSEVRRDLVTRSGEITLEGASVVAGDLVVRKSSCWGWCWSSDRPARVVIGAGARVDGEIRIEHESELWVHRDARIGRVSGAEVRRFDGARP